MKSLVTSSLLALFASGAILSVFDTGAAGLTQEEDATQEEAEDDSLIPPIKRFRRQEQRRFEKEIVGNWILVDFKDPNNPLSEEYVDGWAAFHDGYMTMFLSMRTFERAIFKNKEQRYFQYGAHRYRISEELYLQTATIMASTNINEDHDILYEESGFAREFQIELRENVMEMTNRDRVTFEFRRVDDTNFPIEAIQGLQESR